MDDTTRKNISQSRKQSTRFIATRPLTLDQSARFPVHHDSNVD